MHKCTIAAGASHEVFNTKLLYRSQIPLQASEGGNGEQLPDLSTEQQNILDLVM